MNNISIFGYKKNLKRTMRYSIFQLIVLVLFLSILSLSEAGIRVKYEKKGKRNPFIPYVTNDGQITNIKDEDEDFSLNLEGLIYDKKGQSMVIINGEILKENDSLGDVKIIEIRKDSIVYVKNGEIFIKKSERGEIIEN